MMNRSMINKFAAIGLAGAMALAVATPSYARGGRVAAAAVGGFAAGALIGSAAAGPHYGYYGPGYGYDPGYAYEPGYADSYAYVPAPTYRGYGYGDYEVGATGSGSPVYRSQLGGGCTLGLKQQDRC